MEPSASSTSPGSPSGEAPALALPVETLAALLGAELRGSAPAPLSAIDSLEAAAMHSLSFIRDAKHAHRWATTNAGAVLVSRRVVDAKPDLFALRDGHALLIVEDADMALIALLERITPTMVGPLVGVHPLAAIDPTATVAETARIGAGVAIGPHSTVGDHAILHPGVVIGASVHIGEASELQPRVVILDRCSIGARCLLQPGVVIGGDGFGFRPNPSGGPPIKIPHAGGVKIGDDVEIGANTTIDRGKFGDTTIGHGTKIDNLVQIGHNCVIGNNCLICGMVGLAGSVRLGDGVTLGGGVGIADGRRVGDGATLGAKAGLMVNVPAGETWLGAPAVPSRQAMRQFAAIESLPELIRPIRRLLKGKPGSEPSNERP